MQTTWKSFK